MEYKDTDPQVWLSEVINDCLMEVSIGKTGVDLKLLNRKVREEPKSAQAAMQILALILEENLKGKDISQATGNDQAYRLILGSLYISYIMVFAPRKNKKLTVEDIPPELASIVKVYPIIQDCAEFVSKTNQ
ncbi:MAG: hypothetical protein ACFE8E_14165 [Candidatus Hodarchaeota archaeon]